MIWKSILQLEFFLQRLLFCLWLVGWLSFAFVHTEDIWSYFCVLKIINVCGFTTSCKFLKVINVLFSILELLFWCAKNQTYSLV